LPPFRDVTVPFVEDDGSARPLTVLFGGGGVGKTTLVGAIASTRPGYSAVPTGSGEGEAFAVADWLLGSDDAERPLPLTVATPTAKVAPSEQEELLRRRQQAHYDRVARDGGFAFLAIPSTRWFSRQPIAFAAPARTIARYDVRGQSVLEDASRTDLARDTKQALAYAAISAALSRDRSAAPFARLAEAMAHAVDGLVTLSGFTYAGIDPGSFEPVFKSEDGTVVPFDGLPTRSRHLVSFAALSVRTLWAAQPRQSPLEVEGVVCIDEIELHQDAAVQGSILAALRRVLPSVQWIVTTASPIVAASAEEREVHALRRLSQAESVEIFSGPEARVH
jgi:hypothetical protein